MYPTETKTTKNRTNDVNNIIYSIYMYIEYIINTVYDLRKSVSYFH